MDWQKLISRWTTEPSRTEQIAGAQAKAERLVAAAEYDLDALRRDLEAVLPPARRLPETAKKAA